MLKGGSRLKEKVFKKWTIAMTNAMNKEKEEVQCGLTCVEDAAKTRDDNVAKKIVSINNKRFKGVFQM